MLGTQWDSKFDWGWVVTQMDAPTCGSKHIMLLLLTAEICIRESGSLAIAFPFFLPRFFRKNFVKVTFSLKIYQFDEKIFMWGKIYKITTLLCKAAQCGKFTLTKKIFREIISLVVSFSKNVAFTKFFAKNV